MADRVSASIEIGGNISASGYAELAEIITAEGLSVEWDGETFKLEHRTTGEPLTLYAHEVPWGRFEELESWCIENRLPVARWSGGFGSEWTGERVVFTGDGAPWSYIADECDRILVDRATVEQLGSIEAILAHFDAANAVLPPLAVEGETTRKPSEAAID
ncbi:hypothetical protein [Chelatococcus asaccharovorans]|uniref:hypothetical protein n=1 Tax=Chelatococcus asaccharovorans TaxID=28210 RepID=UPI00224C75E3|nr:hypothetical protein [Chelatococcus asaccharovorans]CAH1667027.1 conserved hypothetical protein [Chelatococcus asaccharovorans]CAH1681195.1 conserved hypothetical protein [Chelatococcus asaccharovorans]HMR30100.1 hypothetical protein [Geminicoccus sp.]HMU50518.1 hypothetical protein [Geminicoccaceae bacterium]